MSPTPAKSDYAKDYFYINRRFLRLAGLWPPENPSRLGYYGYKLLQVVVYLVSVVVCVPCVFLGSLQQRGDLELMLKSFNLFLSVFMGAVKAVFWGFRSKHMIEITKTLESEEYYYEDCGDFNPGVLTKRARGTGIRYALGFCVLSQLTLGFLYGPSYARGFWYWYNDWPVANVSSFAELPYYTYVPFKYDTAPKYLMAITFQCLPFYMYGFSLIGFDTLFMNIMNFIGIHLDILNGAFRSLRKRSLMKVEGHVTTTVIDHGLYNSVELEEMMMCEMKKCIRHLKMVIRMCAKLEENYNLIVLAQVLSMFYILCVSLLLVSTTPVLSTQFANELTYLLTMYFQLVLYCWFGNKIRLKVLSTPLASVLPQALWEGEWLGTRKPFQTCMLLTIQRMQRPMVLTVGKFSPLTLETFIAILKGSYSYYTVLKHTRDR